MAGDAGNKPRDTSEASRSEDHTRELQTQFSRNLMRGGSTSGSADPPLKSDTQITEAGEKDDSSKRSRDTHKDADQEDNMSKKIKISFRRLSDVSTSGAADPPLKSDTQITEAGEKDDSSKRSRDTHKDADQEDNMSKKIKNSFRRPNDVSISGSTDPSLERETRESSTKAQRGSRDTSRNIVHLLKNSEIRETRIGINKLYGLPAFREQRTKTLKGNIEELPDNIDHDSRYDEVPANEVARTYKELLTQSQDIKNEAKLLFEYGSKEAKEIYEFCNKKILNYTEKYLNHIQPMECRKILIKHLADFRKEAGAKKADPLGESGIEALPLPDDQRSQASSSQNTRITHSKLTQLSRKENPDLFEIERDFLLRRALKIQKVISEVQSSSGLNDGRNEQLDHDNLEMGDYKKVVDEYRKQLEVVKEIEVGTLGLLHLPN